MRDEIAPPKAPTPKASNLNDADDGADLDDWSTDDDAPSGVASREEFVIDDHVPVGPPQEKDPLP